VGCVIALAIELIAVFCGPCVQISQAQQPNSNENLAAAFAKARVECKALWSDHVFDPLRSKFPLGDEKPTFSMLKNTHRLQAKDKPLADLAIKTIEKCRRAQAPVIAMFPEQTQNLFLAVERTQDALIADLYNGKITIGDYNVGINRVIGEYSLLIAGVPVSSQPDTSVTAPTPESAQDSPAASQPKPVASKQSRLALVIGNSNYAELPKLSNPANDARAIADVLQKMGYQTRLLLDGSSQTIRKEVRKFADDSTKADVAVVYYAGHGAQLHGNNYLLPVGPACRMGGSVRAIRHPEGPHRTCRRNV
jgi:hypothetical protein